MDWVPQTTEPVIELFPPLPPKMNEVAAPQNGLAVGFSQSANASVLTRQDNDSAPVLPPKPTCKYVCCHGPLCVIYSTIITFLPKSRVKCVGGCGLGRA